MMTRFVQAFYFAFLHQYMIYSDQVCAMLTQLLCFLLADWQPYLNLKKTRKIKIAERKTIRPIRNPNENYYLPELVFLTYFLLLNTPNPQSDATDHIFVALWCEDVTAYPVL